MLKRTNAGLSLILLSFYLLTGLISACGQQRTKNHPKTFPDTSVYFIHGDPLLLVKNTEGNSKSFFTSENMDQFSDYTLIATHTYAEATAKADVKSIKNQQELENENRTDGDAKDETEDQSLNPFNFYRFVKVEDGFKYAVANVEVPTNKKYKELFFKTGAEGTLTLHRVDQSEVKVLHYSITEDRNVFSLLLFINGEQGKMLLDLFFVKKKQREPIVHLNVPYDHFLLGDGYAFTWKRDLTISLCGEMSAQRRNDFRKAIENWSIKADSSVGVLGSLRYKIDSYRTVAKPFTDLNQICIRSVPDFRAEKDLSGPYVTLGRTQFAVDPYKNSIVYGNIFLFDRALKVSGADVVAVLMHEIGHLWGLGHEFDTAKGKAYPSIMSYSEGQNEITDWDILAVKSLYPQLGSGQSYAARDRSF